MSNSMFSFSDAVAETGSKYLEPGISEVKLISIKLSTSQKGKPYIVVTASNNADATCAHTYSLDTEVNPGKQVSAWSVSKNSIFQLASAILGEAKARTAMEANSPEEFTTKLSAALIGKPVRLKIVGEEVLTNNGNKFVKSHFGTSLFAENVSVPVDQSRLKFDPIRNIKRLPDSVVEETSSTPWS